MKYFTPDLLLRVRSLDDDISAQGHAEWEQALARYHRRLRKIQAHLPEAVHQFRRQLCLHDAQLLNMARQDDTFFMVVQLEPPSQTVVVLTFTLEGEPRIDPAALPGKANATSATWMYEEFDVDRRQQCSLEVLFSNGWTVQLRFRNFQFLIGEKLFPAQHGQTLASAGAPVPRSA